MEQKNQDMTSGSLAKGILFFSIPLMLSNILHVLFNMSDIAVVGHLQAPWRWDLWVLPRSWSPCLQDS